MRIPLCDWCSASLPARDPHRAGRPRQWCSNRCRKAAFRARHRRDLERALAFAVELPQLPARAPPDELIVQAVIEVRGTAATFARLAPIARRDFGWRCERAAVEIKRVVDDYFPGV